MQAQYFKILIVDDHDLSIAVAVRTLAARGFTCEAARSAAEAVACIAQFQPDVVLYEWNLGTGDGLGLPRRIRAVSSSPITIIALSTQDEPHDFCAIEGVDAYATKPCDVVELVSALAR